MNLVDMFKDKATELLQGATGKVSELTGLPLGDVVDQAGQAAADITGAGQNPTDTATGAVTDATGVITDATVTGTWASRHRRCAGAGLKPGGHGYRNLFFRSAISGQSATAGSTPRCRPLCGEECAWTARSGSLGVPGAVTSRPPYRAPSPATARPMVRSQPSRRVLRVAAAGRWLAGDGQPAGDQRHNHRGFLRPNDTGHEP